MTADISFFWLAVLAFSHECVADRRGRTAAGDRLLFLAYAMLIMGYAALLRRWGVL